ncbi:hypothetical protein [Prevotella sp. HMSC073D09]|uniref:hypothetical protein n=1 Tax=Prevotella sp. HMSC073D09 TaxID=1739459 RepID=UPI0014392392|nr:hypothetical protein [Prevotella sp. HMSC073D09]
MKNGAAQSKGNPRKSNPKTPLNMKNRAAQSKGNPTREQPQNPFEYEERGCIKQEQP